MDITKDRIKFRVFAKVEDDDGCVGYLETRSPIASGIDFFYDGGWRGINYFLLFPETFTVQQYTGLKDKNEKDIYDGDILSNEDGIDYVYFKNGCFWIDDLWLYDHAYNNEVIGNILENSDLLK